MRGYTYSVARRTLIPWRVSCGNILALVSYSKTRSRDVKGILFTGQRIFSESLRNVAANNCLVDAREDCGSQWLLRESVAREPGRAA